MLGGGIGVWLNVIKNKIPQDKFNGRLFDGDYLTRDMILDPDLFEKCDLENELTKKEKFDLVICLEVAEHLSKTRADSFIADLAQLGDIILFSAAIPFQGGVGHINEQPSSYWRKLFESNGFECFDIIRPEIKDDENIPFWYKNNCFVYIKKTVVSDTLHTNNDFVDFVHWEMYNEEVSRLQNEIAYKDQMLQQNRWTIGNFFKKVARKIGFGKI